MAASHGTAEVVLVHGAFHGAWCWDGVVDALRADGVKTNAVELPFSGFADDVAAARSAIEAAGPGCVVVAHSYGGAVVSGAARDLPVGRLVYLAALMLDEDEDPALILGSPEGGFVSALTYADGMLALEPTRARDLLFADSDPATARAAIARLRPMVPDGLVSGRPAWRDIPSTYVVCAADQAIPPSSQRAMAANATDVLEWPTDHSPFMSRPGDVAQLVMSHLG